MFFIGQRVFVTRNIGKREYSKERKQSVDLPEPYEKEAQIVRFDSKRNKIICAYRTPIGIEQWPFDHNCVRAPQ